MYEILSNEQMGRVIAFWSPIHRQGATSTTAALIASFIAEKIGNEKDGGKVLVMSNELFGSFTAGDYLTSEDMPDGLTEVVVLSNCGNLKTYEDIYNNTFSGVENLDILSNNKKNSSLTSSDIEKEIKNILNVAKTGYKYIIVDCVAGKHDIATLSILKRCDIIVVCMPQDRHIIDNWIRKISNVYLPECEHKPTVMVLEQYYDYRHISYDRLCKEFKVDADELCYIDLSDTVNKAVNDRKIPELIRNIHKEKDNELELQIKLINNSIEDAIQKVVNDEIKKAEEIDERNRQETQEYIGNMDLFNIDYSSNNIEPSLTDEQTPSSDYAQDTGYEQDFGYSTDSGYTQDDLLDGSTSYTSEV